MSAFSIVSATSSGSRPPNRQPWRSPADAIAEMGDAGPVEDPGQLELHVVRPEVIEEPPPLAEQNRDQVDLQLVEDAGSERQRRGARTVDEHVLLPAASFARAIAVSTSLT